ncbi:hypothetical protein [Sandarakinorhabdus sp.]|uniref:hypothetical protein n=1 Tax=Sandarakinorhabdus sp. TaxID=1916663 RepID=UPI0035688680
MIITRSTIDRLTITALLMTATMPFVALSPVKAATPSCAAQMQAVQASAATADPQAAAKALHTARVAEKICAEGNRFEAAKKFAQSREQLAATVQLADRR